MSDDPVLQAQILIVDDQEPNVLLLEQMLDQAGYTNLHSLTDSREAVPWCLEHLPDLLLLDLHMPYVDGFEVMEQLHPLEGTEQSFPILILTADLTIETKRRGLAGGATDFVTKPFDCSEVLLRVKNHLQAHFRYRQSQGQVRGQAQEIEQAKIVRLHIEQEMYHQTYHDTLTELPNRDWLLRHLKQDLTDATQKPRTTSLLLLSLNHFREVNNTFGYQCGDAVLQQIAERLRKGVRSVDIVARVGGDEFVLLLPGVSSTGAVWTARKVLTALAEPITVNGIQMQVDAGLGIALAPKHGSDADSLLRHAQEATAIAKHNGAGYALFNPTLHLSMPSHLSLARDLQQALAKDQLLLHYQPKLHLRREQLRGFEALVRWDHPQHGLLLPNDFIPIAEHTSIIGPLTEWVLEQALQQCHKWGQAKMALGIAVNISMRSLSDTRLPQVITGLLNTYQISPSALTLEITESALMIDTASTQRALAALASLGVRLSVDNFGTGYSSLNNLRHLPLNEIKIDRSLIQEMTPKSDDKNTTFIRSIIEVGHSLGVQVVIEGIEQRWQRDQIEHLGGDIIQGYYVSPPLSPNDLDRWLETSLWGKARIALRHFGHSAFES